MQTISLDWSMRAELAGAEIFVTGRTLADAGILAADALAKAERDARQQLANYAQTNLPFRLHSLRANGASLIRGKRTSSPSMAAVHDTLRHQCHTWHPAAEGWQVQQLKPLDFVGRLSFVCREIIKADRQMSVTPIRRDHIEDCMRLLGWR